jgi:hypothetical protein
MDTGMRFSAIADASHEGVSDPWVADRAKAWGRGGGALYPTSLLSLCAASPQALSVDRAMLAIAFTQNALRVPTTRADVQVRARTAPRWGEHCLPVSVPSCVPPRGREERPRMTRLTALRSSHDSFATDWRSMVIAPPPPR